VLAPVRDLANAERRRVGKRTGTAIDTPYRPVSGPAWRRGLGQLRDPATWRDMCWLVLAGYPRLVAGFIPLGLYLGGPLNLATPVIRAAGGHFSNTVEITNMTRAYLVAGLGVVYLAAAPWVSRALTWLEIAVARWLLAPTARGRLRARVEELATTRAETVDAQAAELRRIERDLHDGAQARLVALAMSLGMAEDAVDLDPEQAKQLVAEARAAARTALTELRDLVRGIHPPVLADRGLVGALQALALQAPVPAEVSVAEIGRLAPPLESALYFVAAEAMVNVVKHSDASRLEISLERSGDGGTGDMVTLRVTDDGRGGADPRGGTGLRGIQRRIAAFDGRMTLHSPVGGPTVLTVEVPCGS
jgi:signal transduction histidine kinase